MDHEFLYEEKAENEIGRRIVWTGILHTELLKGEARLWSRTYGYAHEEIVILDYDYNPAFERLLPEKYWKGNGEPDRFYIDQIIEQGYSVKVYRLAFDVE